MIEASTVTADQLVIQVSYTLATVSRTESHQFTVGAGGG
jgi:hypothetical protein